MMNRSFRIMCWHRWISSHPISSILDLIVLHVFGSSFGLSKVYIHKLLNVYTAPADVYNTYGLNVVGDTGIAR